MIKCDFERGFSKKIYLLLKQVAQRGNDRSPESQQVFQNSSQVSKRFFQLVKSSKLRSPKLNLSMMMCIQNLVLFCQFVLKILSKKQILTSIKGHNSVANLRKANIYNINVDLVNDNVLTKFGLILPIRSQDIEQKPNSYVKHGP